MLNVAGCRPVCCWQEAEQQDDRVPVGGDGVRAGLTLPDQSIAEERLQQRRQVVHDVSSARSFSSRSAANASSSGVPVRYQ